MVKPPIFYFSRSGIGRVRILTLIALALIISSYSTYSVYMNIYAQSFVLGGSANYNYDSSSDGGYVTKVKLILDGDMVYDAEVSFRITISGLYEVVVYFSNGVETSSNNLCQYFDRGAYTEKLSLERISYYPKPMVEASAQRVPACP